MVICDACGLGLSYPTERATGCGDQSLASGGRASSGGYEVLAAGEIASATVPRVPTAQIADDSPCSASPATGAAQAPPSEVTRRSSRLRVFSMFC